MPGRDGFQLVEAIRAQGGFADLPVIALSSGTTPDAVERARKLRIADFVAKFDRSGLVSALAETQPALGEAA
jgi:two-component system chemotaxis sensor kinase CheA